MRMQMIDPELMCSQHRLGEHWEIHKHRPSFVKRHSIAGRISPEVQIEPMAMKARHDVLAKYFKNHNSPYRMPNLSYLPRKHREAKVDVAKSYQKLIKRCPKCREKYRLWNSKNKSLTKIKSYGKVNN